MQLGTVRPQAGRTLSVVTSIQSRRANPALMSVGVDGARCPALPCCPVPCPLALQSDRVVQGLAGASSPLISTLQPLCDPVIVAATAPDPPATALAQPAAAGANGPLIRRALPCVDAGAPPSLARRAANCDRPDNLPASPAPTRFRTRLPCAVASRLVSPAASARPDQQPSPSRSPSLSVPSHKNLTGPLHPASSSPSTFSSLTHLLALTSSPPTTAAHCAWSWSLPPLEAAFSVGKIQLPLLVPERQADVAPARILDCRPPPLPSLFAPGRQRPAGQDSPGRRRQPLLDCTFHTRKAARSLDSLRHGETFPPSSPASG